MHTFGDNVTSFMSEVSCVFKKQTSIFKLDGNWLAKVKERERERQENGCDALLSDLAITHLVNPH